MMAAIDLRWAHDITNTILYNFVGLVFSVIDSSNNDAPLKKSLKLFSRDFTDDDFHWYHFEVLDNFG